MTLSGDLCPPFPDDGCKSWSSRPTGTNHTIQNSFHPFRRIGAVHCGLASRHNSDGAGVPTAAQRTYAGLQRRALRHIVGPNIKNPPNIRMKISWNWRIILMPATIWQVLKVKRTQRPKTEVVRICWNLKGKTREITLSELIFGGFLAIWNHCAPSLKPRQVNLYQRWPGAMDSANKSISSSSFGKSCRNHDSFLINGLNAITKQKTISPEAAAGGGGVRRRGGGVRRWRWLALGYFIEHFTNAAKQ